MGRALLIKPARKFAAAPEIAFTIYRNGIAERLARASQIKTISTQNKAQFDKDAFKEFHSFLEQAYPRTHHALSKEIFGGYSLLYQWRGLTPSLKPILLMSHIDVVPVDAATEFQWLYPPFSGALVDGFVWGRGALDVKSGIIAIMEAIENLAASGFQPQRAIYIALGHDEEIGGREGNAEIAKALQARGIRLECALDEGGMISQGFIKNIASPVALIGIAEKGYLTLLLSVTGVGGHASTPPAETSIGILAKAIKRIEKNHQRWSS